MFSIHMVGGLKNTGKNECVSGGVRALLIDKIKKQLYMVNMTAMKGWLEESL